MRGRSERFWKRGARAPRALFLALLALGCASYEPLPPPERTTFAAYRVGAPDRLRISVLPAPVIDREVVVRPDGMISMDLIGDVPAAGRTTDDIAADVERRMSRFKRDASVTVALNEALSTEITVLGEVASPSSFPLLKETRVVEVIGAVGGETRFAKTSGIQVVRSGGGETVVYDVNLNAIRAGDLTTNIQMVSGDIVYVPPNIFARIGYATNALFLPLQPFLGIGQSFLGAAIAR
jgi:polysaccharide export outer membrane protein